MATLLRRVLCCRSRTWTYSLSNNNGEKNTNIPGTETCFESNGGAETYDDSEVDQQTVSTVEDNATITRGVEEFVVSTERRDSEATELEKDVSTSEMGHTPVQSADSFSMDQMATHPEVNEDVGGLEVVKVTPESTTKHPDTTCAEESGSTQIGKAQDPQSSGISNSPYENGNYTTFLPLEAKKFSTHVTRTDINDDKARIIKDTSMFDMEPTILNNNTRSTKGKKLAIFVETKEEQKLKQYLTITNNPDVAIIVREFFITIMEKISTSREMKYMSTKHQLKVCQNDKVRKDWDYELSFEFTKNCFKTILNTRTALPHPSLCDQLVCILSPMGPQPQDWNIHPQSVNGIPWNEFHNQYMRAISYLEYKDFPKHPLVLAASGFVYVGDGETDDHICFFCLVTKRGWMENEDVRQVHRANCPQA